MIYAAQLSWLLTSLIVSEIASVFEKKPYGFRIAQITKGRTMSMTGTHVKFHLGTDEREPFKSCPMLPIP